MYVSVITILLSRLSMIFDVLKKSNIFRRNWCTAWIFI